MKLSKLFFEAVLILLLSILSGFLFNSISDEGLPLSYKSNDMEPGSNLSTDEAYRIFLEGRALFLDARYKEEFVAGHIQNARNLPFRASRDEIESFLANISKDRMIVIYCNNPSCNANQRLAGLFSYLEYKNVFMYPGGYEEWISYNYPKQVGE
jgi:rhodanese-related sulfurtransferase